LAAPLVSVSSAEEKLRVLDAASAPQVAIDAAFAQYRSSVEAAARARVETAAVRAQKPAVEKSWGPPPVVAPVVVHTAKEVETKEKADDGETKKTQMRREEKVLESAESKTDLTCRAPTHPVAPHVFLGFCDIGMVGFRLLSSLVPTGKLNLLYEEPIVFSHAFESCWKGSAPLLLKTFGRGQIPEVSLLLVNAQLEGPTISLVSHALVDLLAASGVKQVTVFAGAYLLSSAPASTVHWASLNIDKIPDICAKCQCAKPLPPLASLKDPFLSSLAIFLRISAIPTLFLLMSAKRFHAGQDDGTAPILQTLGDLISKATRHGDPNEGFKYLATAPTSVPKLSQSVADSGFYL